MKLKLSTLTENERGHATAYTGDGNPRANSFRVKKERGREREGRREQGRKRQLFWTFGSGDKIPVLKEKCAVYNRDDELGTRQSTISGLGRGQDKLARRLTKVKE